MTDKKTETCSAHSPQWEVLEGGNFVNIVTSQYAKWHKSNHYLGGPHTICEMTRAFATDNEGPSHETALERAAYIVQACNSYPKLVERLKAIADGLCSCYSTSDPEWHSATCRKAMAETALREAGEL